MNILEQLFENFSAAELPNQALLADSVQWQVSHPFEPISTKQNVINDYFGVLKHSLPDIERKPFISIQGDYKGEQWVCATGYFTGTFTQPLLGIPASGKSVFIRYSEMAQIENNQVVNVYTFLDLIDVMNQIGVNPLRPSLGYPGLVMPPTTLDGVPTGDKNETLSKTNEQLVVDMLTELGRYDGKDLYSINLEKYWHPDFIWYGPAGIGTTRGISGFRKHHQGPFLKGFPDRGINKTLCLVSHDNFVATGGWPHMYGTHTGEDWLGLPPSGNKLFPRVMDFWRCENGILKENWVAIDIPHLLDGMGIDIFEQMQRKIAAAN
ncbi:ester cyclase [Pseudoalteromonas carrageenovora]|uniref:ester cyclase n=1 Tax=Pseudoalteromonas carrageenovora TaxID=227 RepID=UPI0026E2E6B1|nr:ester cyclase [Pseudoalteromonas carrageenovora]MDO6836568.1 ester cyclase [Pseudoalteromonas carrageenovora]